MKPFLIGITFGWAVSSLALLANGMANAGTMAVGIVVAILWLVYLAGRSS